MADARQDTHEGATDPRKAAEPGMARLGESTQMDYWFDMRVDDASGVKHLTTFAYGLQIDQRDNSGDETKDWADLIVEAAPAIQADVNAYGIAP